MNHSGKVAKAWAIARREWLKQNPPNHQGYWVCAICARWVESIEVDHIKSRSRRPDLRLDPDNLQGLCHRCNTRKGSKEHL